MEIKDELLDEKEFHKARQAVLASWPTGREVDFEDACAFHRSLPPEKVMVTQMAKAKAEGRTLIQPRSGVALLKEFIALLQTLQDEGEADLLTATIDSYTRNNLYEKADKAIEESKKAGRSMLNGFPAVNHGVQGCRYVIDSVDRPVQVRHGTPDPRLLAEITLAGGFTDFEGGPISYNIPYAKNIPLEKTLQDWQYVDRLVGLYEQAGIPINREPFGALTGTLVPPSICHSVSIIEILLAARQGAKNFVLGYAQCGNLVQDVAAIQTFPELAEKYLRSFGYRDFQLTTALHQWMGQFPEDESMAFAIISWGAVTAALARATKVIVKTPQEAMGIPTAEANVKGLKATKQLLNMLKDQKIEIEGEQLEEEKELIKAETEAIIERVLELGDGDPAQGTVRAFEAGVLDVPFSPSNYNASKVLPARDKQGAVRFLDCGNLPFSSKIKGFHKRRLADRGRAEGRPPSYQMVIDDIYALGEGYLVGKTQNP